MTRLQALPAPPVRKRRRPLAPAKPISRSLLSSRSSWNHNRVARLERNILAVVALERLLIVKRDLLLFSLYSTQYIDMFLVGKHRQTALRSNGLHRRHSRSVHDRTGVIHLAHQEDLLAVDRQYNHRDHRVLNVLFELLRNIVSQLNRRL